MLTKKCQKLYAETKKLQSKKITKMRKFPIAKCQTAEKNTEISFLHGLFFLSLLSCLLSSCLKLDQMTMKIISCAGFFEYFRNLGM